MLRIFQASCVRRSENRRGTPTFLRGTGAEQKNIEKTGSARVPQVFARWLKRRRTSADRALRTSAEPIFSTFFCSAPVPRALTRMFREGSIGVPRGFRGCSAGVRALAEKARTPAERARTRAEQVQNPRRTGTERARAHTGTRMCAHLSSGAPSDSKHRSRFGMCSLIKFTSVHRPCQIDEIDEPAVTLLHHITAYTL